VNNNIFISKEMINLKAYFYQETMKSKLKKKKKKKKKRKKKRKREREMDRAM
jgi:hypothetical protein